MLIFDAICRQQLQRAIADSNMDASNMRDLIGIKKNFKKEIKQVKFNLTFKPFNLSFAAQHLMHISNWLKYRHQFPI